MAAFICNPGVAASSVSKTFGQTSRSILSFPPSSVLSRFSQCSPKAPVGSSTLLSVAAAPVVDMMDFSAEALGFFTGVRIPSALIAGSSLGAVFSLVSLANKNRQELPRVDVLLLRLYHVFALASLVLSLNVVIMSTVASTTLLLDHHDTMALSAYQFLNREMRYEFVITRWSFLMSILCFLIGITSRALLEFNLLKTTRRRYGLCLILFMNALLTHLISFINETLYNWASLTSMTVTVVKLIVNRAMRQRKPLEIVSLLSAIGSVLCLPWVVHGVVWRPRRRGHEQEVKSTLEDDEDYDLDAGIDSSTLCEPPTGEGVDGTGS